MIKDWGFSLRPDYTAAQFRADLLIGYPFSFAAAVVVVPPATLAPLNTTYFKRYLNDPDQSTGVLVVNGPTPDINTEQDTPFTKYMRRYLNDTQ